MRRLDGDWRWYGTVPEENLTIEVMDYKVFVERALQRNHAFFENLGFR